MSLEHVRVSEQGRAQLIKLKRYTNIQHWNTLCRWAFCLSLAEQSPPAPAKVPADSNVEMSWKTFGGPFAEVYLALLKERLRRDGLEVTDENLTIQFRSTSPRNRLPLRRPEDKEHHWALPPC